jgi:hypothetical protein
VRIGNADGRQLNSVAISRPAGRAAGQLLEDFFRYDMWNALTVS